MQPGALAWAKFICLGLMGGPCNSLSSGAFFWGLPLCSHKLRSVAWFPEVLALGMSTVTFPVTSMAAWQLSAIRSGVPGSPAAVGEAVKGQPRV